MRHNVEDEIIRIIFKEKKYNVELYEQIGYESNECEKVEKVEEVEEIEEIEDITIENIENIEKVDLRSEEPPVLREEVEEEKKYDNINSEWLRGVIRDIKPIIQMEQPKKIL